jgi:hypothetical protein
MLCYVINAIKRNVSSVSGWSKILAVKAGTLTQPACLVLAACLLCLVNVPAIRHYDKTYDFSYNDFTYKDNSYNAKYSIQLTLLVMTVLITDLLIIDFTYN